MTKEQIKLRINTCNTMIALHKTAKGSSISSQNAISVWGLQKKKLQDKLTKTN